MVKVVYRYGHRIGRDKRITTHVALTARAFGADGIVVDTPDKKLEESVGDVVNRFGGEFFIETGVKWRDYIKKWKGRIVHLTMYGENVMDCIDDIRKWDDILIIVGSEKVPGEFYEIAHRNVAIGNQPHSEVAALAVFLHLLTDGGWNDKKFEGVMEVVPTERGKKIRYNYEEILRREGCSKAVIEHCRKVAALAMEIARRIEEKGRKIDMDAVYAGAMLHDVGRARTHGIMHIVEGVKIARKYGLPSKILNIIKHHGGAGIDEEEAEKLGLPPGDYIPVTIEEMIVAHADNLTGYRYRKFRTAYAMFRMKAGKKAALKMKELHEKLSEMAGEDIDNIVEKLKSKRLVK